MPPLHDVFLGTSLASLAWKAHDGGAGMEGGGGGGRGLVNTVLSNTECDALIHLTN